MADVEHITPEKLADMAFEYMKNIICKNDAKCIKFYRSGMTVLTITDEILKYFGLEIRADDIDTITRIAGMFTKKNEKTGMKEILEFEEKYNRNVDEYISNINADV